MEAHRAPGVGLGRVTQGLLTAGGTLLVVGIGLLAWGHNPRDGGNGRTGRSGSADAAHLPIPTSESDPSRDGGSAVPGPNVAPLRAPDRLASAFVWGTWALMLLAALAFVRRYGSNYPMWDDFSFVPYQTGDEPISFAWLWSLYNEHLIPLPKIINIALWRLSGGDYRSGMYYDVSALGILALALILGARRLRGRTSYADAFFPIALLNWGHYVNFIWGFQVQFITSTILAVALLLIITRRGGRVTLGAAISAETCLALLLLCGANGLGLVPALALWLGYVIVLRWFSPGSPTERKRLLISGLVSFLLILVSLYISAGIKRTAWAPPASTWQRLSVALQFLTLGLGPAYGDFWPFTGVVIFGLLLLTSSLLAMAWFNRPLERPRALGLLLFMGSMAALALGVGWGRAGLVSPGSLLACGSGGGKATARYVTLAVPMLCCAYYAWILYGPPTIRRLVQLGLFALVLLIAPINMGEGMAAAGYYRRSIQGFEVELRSGAPLYILTAHHRTPDFMQEEIALVRFARLLQRAGVGQFRYMREDPAFRAIPLPVAPCTVNRVEMEPEAGKGHGFGSESYLTFPLPGPMYVAGIRIRGTCNNDLWVRQYGGFKVFFRKVGQPDFPEVPQYHGLRSWSGDFGQTIYVADTIDRIRIHPGDDLCDFHISGLDLLVPFTEAEGRPSSNLSGPITLPVR